MSKGQLIQTFEASARPQCDVELLAAPCGFKIDVPTISHTNLSIPCPVNVFEVRAHISCEDIKMFGVMYLVGARWCRC
jgi:hypothetical protein